MSQETGAILRAVLYQAKMSKNADDIITAVEAMCTEETIAYVEKKVAQAKARQER
ncbi:MAG: hypothetical protein LBR85_07695 [Oscillospiraceae bacterium]|nr:hypothetical protein [Oscillospiraceae bacterium]